MFFKTLKIFKKKANKTDILDPSSRNEPMKPQEPRTEIDSRMPSVPLAKTDFAEPPVPLFEPSLLLTSNPWTTTPCSLPQRIPKSQCILANHLDVLATTRRKVNRVHHRDDQLTDYARPMSHGWQFLQAARLGERPRSRGSSLVDEDAMRMVSRAHCISQREMPPSGIAPTLDAQNPQPPLQMWLVPHREVEIVPESIPEEENVRERNRRNGTPWKRPKVDEWTAWRERMYFKMWEVRDGDVLEESVEESRNRDLDNSDWKTEEEEVRFDKENKNKNKKRKERPKKDTKTGDADSVVGEMKNGADSVVFYVGNENPEDIKEAMRQLKFDGCEPLEDVDSEICSVKISI